MTLVLRTGYTHTPASYAAPFDPARGRWYTPSHSINTLRRTP